MNARFIGCRLGDVNGLQIDNGGVRGDNRGNKSRVYEQFACKPEG